MLTEKLENKDVLLLEGNQEIIEAFEKINPESTEYLAYILMNGKKIKFIEPRRNIVIPSQEVREKFGYTNEAIEKLTSAFVYARLLHNDETNINALEKILYQLKGEYDFLNPEKATKKMDEYITANFSLGLNPYRQINYIAETYIRPILKMIDYADWLPKFKKEFYKLQEEGIVAAAVDNESFNLIKQGLNSVELIHPHLGDLIKEDTILEKYINS